MADRPVQGVERLWLAADRIAPPFVIHAVVEGRVDDPEGWPGRVAAAVRTVARAHPGFSARLVGVGPWTRWRGDGPAPPVREVPDAGWDGRTPDGASWLADPIDVRRGPVAEVLLVRGQRERLVLRAHHAVADGRAMGGFLRSLFAVLRGEPPAEATVAPRDVELLDALGSRPPPWTAPRRDRVPLTGEVTEVSTACTWRHRRLASPPGPALLPRLLLALRAARLPGVPDQPLRVSLPVDLRPPGATWDGNLTGIAHLAESATEDLERARDAIREARDPARAGGLVTFAHRLRWLPIALLAASGAGANRAQQQAGRFETTATVSNLGRVRLAERSGGGFTATSAWWIPPPSPGNALFLLVSGDEAGLDLCASAPVGLASGGRLDALLGRVADALG